jgi:hypothetical protein
MVSQLPVEWVMNCFLWNWWWNILSSLKWHVYIDDSIVIVIVDISFFLLMSIDHFVGFFQFSSGVWSYFPIKKISYCNFQSWMRTNMYVSSKNCPHNSTTFPWALGSSWKFHVEPSIVLVFG